MKKLIVLAFVCLLVSTVAAYATGPVRFNQYQEVQTFVATNDTVNNTVMQLSSTSKNILVATKDRILGWTITPIGVGSSGAAYFGFYDTAINPNNAALAFKGAAFDLANLEAEIETGNSSSLMGGSITVWYPYPYPIRDGVAISLGSKSALTIYYEHR